jgi:hypothetical protein
VALFCFHLVQSGGEQLKQSESWRLFLRLRLLLGGLLLLRFGCSMRRSWQLQVTLVRPASAQCIPALGRQFVRRARSRKNCTS